MKQLSKDYRLILTCSLIGVLLALLILKLPALVHEQRFWLLLCCMGAGVILIGVGSLYFAARKLQPEQGSE